MLNQIVELLQQKGYMSLPDIPDGAWFRDSEEKVYVVVLSMYQKGVSSDAYKRITSQMEYVAATHFHKKAEVLHLILTKNGMFEEELIQVVGACVGVWILAMDTGRIYIFENQPMQFDGLQMHIEQGLTLWKRKGSTFSLQPVNIAIVLCNILCFLLVILVNRNLFASYDTDIMLQMGALTYDKVMDGQWLRLVSSIFLHFGFEHLMNNMILLVYAGCVLEKKIGHLPYLILYIACGVLGNVASLLYYNYMGEYVVSAGASGAIFGIVGALFVILLKNHSDSQELSAKGIAIMVILTIYNGLTTMGIDNAAHIGGLLCGIIGGFLLSKISRCVKLE